MTPDNYGLPIDSDVLAAMGAAVVWQSGIELTLTYAITCLLGIHPQEGQLVAGSMGFRTLCNRTEALVLLRVSKTSPEFKEFNKIIAAFKNFNKFRNKITQSFWYKSKVDSSSDSIILSDPLPYSPIASDEISVELHRISETIHNFSPALKTILAHPSTRDT